MATATSTGLGAAPLSASTRGTMQPVAPCGSTALSQEVDAESSNINC